MIADIPLWPILAKLAEGLLATLALSLIAFALGGLAAVAGDAREAGFSS